MIDHLTMRFYSMQIYLLYELKKVLNFHELLN
jgi:hypothetical protein